jgi:methionyl aminopeptidase
MAIEIKSQREIEGIRKSSQMAADTLMLVSEILRPGLTTEQINEFVHDDTLRRGAIPSPLNYNGFPKSVCTSINEVVCHGIPGPRKLREGDIINIDVTTFFEGFHGDTSATFYIGEPTPEAKHVTEVARKCLSLGIAEVRDGARLGDIGAAVQEFAEAQNCSVVRQFVGHGIGRRFHEPPHVAHFGKRGKGSRLRTGMVFTIEPMINLGTWEVEILKDDWTAITKDRRLSAQFEHTIAVTKDGCDILTARKGSLKNSEIYPLFFP